MLSEVGISPGECKESTACAVHYSAEVRDKGCMQLCGHPAKRSRGLLGCATYSGSAYTMHRAQASKEANRPTANVIQPPHSAPQAGMLGR